VKLVAIAHTHGHREPGAWKGKVFHTGSNRNPFAQSSNSEDTPRHTRTDLVAGR
jgi:hypothetical protein